MPPEGTFPRVRDGRPLTPVRPLATAGSWKRCARGVERRADAPGGHRAPVHSSPVSTANSSREAGTNASVRRREAVNPRVSRNREAAAVVVVTCRDPHSACVVPRNREHAGADPARASEMTQPEEVAAAEYELEQAKRRKQVQGAARTAGGGWLGQRRGATTAEAETTGSAARRPLSAAGEGEEADGPVRWTERTQSDKAEEEELTSRNRPAAAASRAVRSAEAESAGTGPPTFLVRARIRVPRVVVVVVAAAATRRPPHRHASFFGNGPHPRHHRRRRRRRQ